MQRIRLERSAQTFGDKSQQLFGQSVGRLSLRGEYRKANDGLSFDLVWHSDRCRLGNGRVLDQYCLDLAWTHPFAGYFDGGRRTAEEKPQAILVLLRPVTVVPDIREATEIGLDITLRIAQETLGH